MKKTTKAGGSFFYSVALSALLLFTGCGKIADKNELLRFSSETYGENTLLYEESSEESNTIVLKDKEYGFEYAVLCRMEEINLDGTSFGSKPVITSTFTENYTGYFLDSYREKISAIELKYDCSITENEFYNPASEKDICFYLTTDLGDYEEPLNLFAAYVKEYDDRKYFRQGVIYVRQENEAIGEYSLEKETMLLSEEADTQWALSVAADVMKNEFKVKIDGPGHLDFLYLEKKNIKDIEGISDATIAYRTSDTAESLSNTRVWHYSYQGEEWIVADCITDGHLYVHKVSNN